MSDLFLLCFWYLGIQFLCWKTLYCVAARMIRPENTREKLSTLIQDQPTIMNLIQHVSHPTNGIRKAYHTQCVAIIWALKLITFFRPLFTQRNPLDWIFFLDQSSFFPSTSPLAPSPTLAYHLLRTIKLILYYRL